jgi:L-2-hydroxycarboxylate dehydrogenase (NAD+)
MRVDAFRSTAEFKEHMDNWISRFRAAKTIAGQDKVIIPGDPERETSLERMSGGIPLNIKVAEDLIELGKKTGIAFS